MTITSDGLDGISLDDMISVDMGECLGLGELLRDVTAPTNRLPARNAGNLVLVTVACRVSGVSLLRC
jgi:hypothetical protein